MRAIFRHTAGLSTLARLNAGLFVVVSAAALTAAARGDEPAKNASASDGPNTAELFKRLDVNQDGQVSADEVVEEKRRLFDRLLRTSDKNQDGKLSLEEFAAGLAPEARSHSTAAVERGSLGEGPTPERLFRRLDANRDGKLTLDEVPEPRRKQLARLFERGDRDGDRALSMSEFVDALSAARNLAGAGADRAREALADPKQFFARFDKNGDGKLTADEVPEPRRAFVERLIRRGDKDHDQALSLDEFRALRPPRADGEPSANGAPAAGPAGATRAPGGLFARFDTDHDGRLSSDEVSAAADVLHKLDANGDGSITPDEVLLEQSAPPGK